jgi:hypothetical protein
MLSDPDGYFAKAYARAWWAAEAEIDADLAERAKQHGDDHPGPPHAPTWLPAITQLSTRP